MQMLLDPSISTVVIVPFCILGQFIAALMTISQVSPLKLQMNIFLTFLVRFTVWNTFVQACIKHYLNDWIDSYGSSNFIDD